MPQLNSRLKIPVVIVIVFVLYYKKKLLTKTRVPVGSFNEKTDDAYPGQLRRDSPRKKNVGGQKVRKKCGVRNLNIDVKAYF